MEFANVLVVNKADLMADEDVGELTALLKRLNPEATIVTSVRGRVEFENILDTGSFNFDKAANSPGWMKEMRGREISEADEYGFSSVVFRARKPLHPERFAAFLEDVPKHGVVRAKGFLWLATRPTEMGILSLAGRSCAFNAGGHWLADTSRDEWDLSSEEEAEALASWDEKVGDRGQELVLIGQSLDQENVSASLSACLLTDSEMSTGAQTWLRFKDPFPAWSTIDD